LGALEAQTIRNALEIIVVDDGSQDADAVERVVARSRTARLVRRPAAGGVAAARNTGVEAARAPLVCFTDDDCEPVPEWAARVAAAFARGADAVAGLTLNGYPDNRFDEAAQLISNFLAERAALSGSRTRFGVGSNLSARAEVLEAFPFDERYRGAGEERDWCARISEAGYVLIAEPSAINYHKQGLDLKAFWRKQTHYGRGAYSFRRISHSPRPLEPWGFYRDLVRRGFRAGAGVGVLVVLAQLAVGVGFLDQWWRDRRSPAGHESPA
jgi:GT2 family glycosyltransferase